MTKLSDALRGMADRAPIGDVSISPVAAAQRVKRTRAIRTTANSVVGAGAVAVVALGVILPMQNSPQSPTLAEAAGAKEDGPSIASATDGYTMAALVCGDQFVGAPWTLPVTASADPDEIVVEPETFAELTMRVQAATDLKVEVEPAQAYVLHEGRVVGVGYAPPMANAMEATAGTSWSSKVTVEPYNCFDAAALPPGDYQVVLTQLVTAADTIEIIAVSPGESTEQKGAEQKGTDAPAPEPKPDTAVSDSGETLTVLPVGSSQLVWTEPVSFTISGEAPDDPFGGYQNGSSQLPSDALTPDAARREYELGLTNSPWDMAPGTQRSLVVSDSRDANSYSYMGCGWEGQPARWPTASSTWSPYKVSGTIPSRVSLKYGWVVQDNPVVTLKGENTSPYSLSNIYDVNSTLLLMKNGQPVAEVYLSNLDAYDTSLDWSGLLSPGGKHEGEFLWRDVFGCYDESGYPTEISGGTYTVLHMQSLYLSNDDMYRIPVEPYMGEILEGTADTGNVAVQAPALDQTLWAPGEWLDIQVFTSLGQVTITKQ